MATAIALSHFGPRWRLLRSMPREGEKELAVRMMRFWDFPVQPSDHLFGKGDYYACRVLREGEIIRAMESDSNTLTLIAESKWK